MKILLINNKVLIVILFDLDVATYVERYVVYGLYFFLDNILCQMIYYLCVSKM